MTRGYLSEVFVSFQGEGLFLGQRHLFVRMSGCNLRCRYCDTPDSLEREPEYSVLLPGQTQQRLSNPISSAELSQLLRPFFAAREVIDAIAVTGGEPLMQAAFLREWLTEARPPAPVLLETSGMLPEALSEVVELVDIISMDLKLPSNTGEPEFWQQHSDFARLASKRKLYAKILVDASTLDSEFARAVELLALTAPHILLYIQPITEASGAIVMDMDRLARLHGEARRRLEEVRVVPQVHKLLGIR